MSVATIYNFIRRATCACVRPLSFEAARYHAEGPELFLKTHIGSNSPVSVDMQPSFNGKLFNLLIFPMYSPKAGIGTIEAVQRDTFRAKNQPCTALPHIPSTGRIHEEYMPNPLQRYQKASHMWSRVP
jgi:hypothetical protein